MERSHWGVRNKSSQAIVNLLEYIRWGCISSEDLRYCHVAIELVSMLDKPREEDCMYARAYLIEALGTLLGLINV